MHLIVFEGYYHIDRSKLNASKSNIYIFFKFKLLRRYVVVGTCLIGNTLHVHAVVV